MSNVKQKQFIEYDEIFLCVYIYYVDEAEIHIVLIGKDYQWFL